MSETPLTPSELRELQRRFYGELRDRGAAVTFVTVGDGADPFLEVGVEEDQGTSVIPASYQGLKVRTRTSSRAVLAIGDREAILS